MGDRWSLLIVRDLMVRGLRTFKDFQQSGERIASNILADRLHKLQVAGIVVAAPEGEDRRRINYRLTDRGIDLAPALLELFLWGARHPRSSAPLEIVDKLASNHEAFLTEVRRRWREHDATPLLPRFQRANFKGGVKK